MASLGDLTPTAQDGPQVELDTFTFYSHVFRVRGAIGLMPLMRFAHLCRAGITTDDVEGLAAVYDMVRDCIHPDDWEEFQQVASDNGADEDTMLEVVKVCIQAAAARPSSRPSDSLPGSTPTDPSTRADSSSPELDTGTVPAGLDPSLVHL